MFSKKSKIIIDVILYYCFLKECYEIVGESRPLSGFPHADFLRKCISNHEYDISNPPSLRAIRALIASKSTFEI